MKIHIDMDMLATLLDLPAGIDIIDVSQDENDLTLYVDGEGLPDVDVTCVYDVVASEQRIAFVGFNNG